ncbi:MAG: NAD(+) diphosphatase [Burkholderiales bacterium]
MRMPFAQPELYAPGFSAPPQPPERALWFVFRRTDILVPIAPEPPTLPRAAHPSSFGLEVAQVQYLGQLGDEHCYAAEVHAEAQPPQGWAFQGLRTLFGQFDDTALALAGRAVQIIDWDRTHRYCGACATPTVVKTTERSRECPACGITYYPRIAPVVMCLVRRERSILLARSPRFPTSTYSALAGFVEAGETLEQCVAREVMEEVSIEVKNLRYFASQPWPFPHSMMIAFHADYAGGDIRVDGVEIADAKFFSVDALPNLPGNISISRKLIESALEEMRG